MTYDAYRESQRRELRSRLRLANAARRSGATHSPANARRQVARLYPPPYTRLELAGLEQADEDRWLEMAGRDHEDWIAEQGWTEEERLDNT